MGFKTTRVCPGYGVFVELRAYGVNFEGICIVTSEITIGQPLHLNFKFWISSNELFFSSASIVSQVISYCSPFTLTNCKQS